VTSELYLNIPIGCNNSDTDIDEKYITYKDDNKKFKYDRELLGHIYVVNLLHQYATKYAYTNTASIMSEVQGVYPNIYPIVETVDSQQILRKYYTNSLGELRSADILPKGYTPYELVSGSWVPSNTKDMHETAGFSRETPYKAPELYKGTASILYNDADYGLSGNYETLVANEYPHKIEYPVKEIYRSKFYDMNNGTVNKRIRDLNFDLFSTGFIDIRTSTANNYNKYFNKIIAETISIDPVYAGYKESFNPTIDYPSGTYYNGFQGYRTISGTEDNFLRIVIDTPRATIDSNGLYKVDDRAAKGKQFHIEIEAEGYTYLSEYNFYWRMIHSHIR